MEPGFEIQVGLTIATVAKFSFVEAHHDSMIDYETSRSCRKSHNRNLGLVSRARARHFNYQGS